MSTLEFKTHISADGAVAPITNWPGGEADAVIVVRQPEQAVSKEERTKAFEGFRQLAELLKDIPGKELMSKKQIRASRLEEKYGDQTEEQRKAAGRKFFETWDGLLEGMADRTMKEIRAERLEKKYGQ